MSYKPDREQVSDPANYAGRGRPGNPSRWLALGGSAVLLRILLLIVAGCLILGAYGLCAVLVDEDPVRHDCAKFYETITPGSEFDGLEVLSISLTRNNDSIEWDKRVCPALLETPSGTFHLWVHIITEASTYWEYEFRTEPVEATDN